MLLLDDIQTRECRAFANAWQNWRGDNLVPRRASVRIEDISKLLHLVSIVEVISPEIATFRLAGTALCQAMGIELTGLNYFDFATAEARGLRVARTCQVASHPCGSHFLFPIAYRSGRTVPTEVVSFPVWPDEPGTPPQLFAMSMALEDMHLEGPAAEPTQLPLAEGFQFIDIGAGITDDELNLAVREPATLHLQAG